MGHERPVIDVSATALRVSQDRLGDTARTVEWVEGDVEGGVWGYCGCGVVFEKVLECSGGREGV